MVLQVFGAGDTHQAALEACKQNIAQIVRYYNCILCLMAHRHRFKQMTAHSEWICTYSAAHMIEKNNAHVLIHLFQSCFRKAQYVVCWNMRLVTVGKVRMKNPQHTFVLYEDIGIYQPRDAPPRRVFFGRMVCTGGRGFVQQFSLKTRAYIGYVQFVIITRILLNVYKAHFYGCRMGNAWGKSSTGIDDDGSVMIDSDRRDHRH